MGRTGVSLQELGYMCVFIVPSDYPNPTKQKDPLRYPLSTSAPAVDGKTRVFYSGSRVSPERGSGTSEPHQKLGGAISHVYKCVLGCRCPRSFPEV